MFFCSSFQTFITYFINIKGVKGCGVKCAEKTLSNLASKYSMSRSVYKLYIKAYKGKANIKYREAYSLLKLRVDCT